MEEHPIQGLMKTAMESIKDMVDVNTVVGDPVETPDGSVIVPVSRVTFGFAAGGGDFEEGGGGDRGKNGDAGGGVIHPFAGGSGAGVSVQPVGFLVVGQGTVRMLPVHGGAVIDRLIEMAPGILSQIKAVFQRDGGTAPGGPTPGGVAPGGVQGGGATAGVSTPSVVVTPGSAVAERGGVATGGGAGGNVAGGNMAGGNVAGGGAGIITP